MTTNSVELVQVVKRFGEVTAVDHVSLGIREGEFFSLLGPSGCGKTTTLRLIAGFEMPTEGKVYIGGQLQGYLPAYQRPVNTVFQHYALFPHMDVYRNVAFGLEMQKLPDSEIQKRVSEVLELVHLPGMGSRRPSQLSGGQQQRVALARALVNHPKVLLLDEPLGALDLKLRKAMQVELKALQHQVGITFIYVTHDQEEALTMSDRIAVISKGRVLQIGSPEEIYEHPVNRFVADFIGETNFVPGIVLSLEHPVTLELGPQTHLHADWAEAGLSPGDAALLSIRPEKIYLTPPQTTLERPPAGETASVPGQIEELLYLGTDTRYVVRLTEQASLIARIQNVASGHHRFQVGDRVELHWEMGFARLLKE